MIKIDGRDFRTLNDRIVLTSQAVTLAAFHKRLAKLIKQHEKKIDAIARKQKARTASL